MIIILLCILLILLYKNNQVEPYYNITPYNLHWDIYKCLDGGCVIKKSYDCYEYCKYIVESGARQQCEVGCLDVGDEMFDFLKYQNYNWPLDNSNRYMGNYRNDKNYIRGDHLNNEYINNDYVNTDNNSVLPNDPKNN